MREGQLFLAKQATPLRFVWSWDAGTFAALNPTMVVVSRDADGRWYVTFQVDTADPEPTPEADERPSLREFFLRAPAVGPALALVVAVAVFSVCPDTFLNPDNLSLACSSRW
ncbi:hypothetical protein [Saccharopolyspora pogona]|uniref:hypothetical protein n=1 Tax=Saccharopolyspora pogona TaxID=333966 RepID=UPI001CC233B9|nr:hypothetical protein [Saccharopolyspora pogona]